GAIAFYGEVTIRWESAPPLRAVNGLQMEGRFAKHHVLSVTGLPPQMIEAEHTGVPGIFAGTTLVAGNRDPVHPDYVTFADGKRRLVFSFPSDRLKITHDTKAIVF